MIAQLSESQRKEAFSLLVHLQDQGWSVEDSRAKIAAQLAVRPTDVRTIEQEGIKQAWPPLDAIA